MDEAPFLLEPGRLGLEALRGLGKSRRVGCGACADADAGVGDRMSGKSTDVSALSFEDALAELEQIVRGLESGQQKLEDAIAA